MPQRWSWTRSRTRRLPPLNARTPVPCNRPCPPDARTPAPPSRRPTLPPATRSGVGQTASLRSCYASEVVADALVNPPSSSTKRTHASTTRPSFPPDAGTPAPPGRRPSPPPATRSGVGKTAPPRSSWSPTQSSPGSHENRGPPRPVSPDVPLVACPLPVRHWSGRGRPFCFCAPSARRCVWFEIPQKEH